MTLQNIKGIGAKAIASISVEELAAANNISAFYELLVKNFEKNKRIQLPSVLELEQLLENNSNILKESRKIGIETYTFLDEEFPFPLTKIAQPCHLLFVKGNETILKKKSVAIIGTREISKLGEKVGHHLAKNVVDHGWVVTSGLAIGCDTSGHEGCIEAGGQTIAILAGGLDSIYPKQNTYLAQRILETGGCLISEYPIRVKSNPYRLVARDRLQSGLSAGVIVVETGEQSGTMHAVNHALAERMPLGCTDFDRFSPEHCDSHIHALGNRMLIQEGKAMGLYDKDSIEAFLSKCDDVYGHSYFPLNKEDGSNYPQLADSSLAYPAMQQSLFEE